MWHIQVLQPQGSPMWMTKRATPAIDGIFGVFNLTYMKLSDNQRLHRTSVY